RESVVTQQRPELPYPGIRIWRSFDRFLHKPLHKRKKAVSVVVDDARIVEHRLEAKQNLTHQVVLTLKRRGVANPDVTVSLEAGQRSQHECGHLSFAADADKRLKRPRLRHVPQEHYELLAFAQMSEPSERLHYKSSIAKPAVAIVPRALSPERFRYARG